MPLFTCLTGNGSWTGTTKGLTLQGEQQILAELEVSDAATLEEVAKQQQKVAKVKTARKRQGDGGA